MDKFVEKMTPFQDVITEGRRVYSDESIRSRGNRFATSAEKSSPRESDEGLPDGERESGGTEGAGQRLLKGPPGGNRPPGQGGGTGGGSEPPTTPESFSPAQRGLSDASSEATGAADSGAAKGDSLGPGIDDPTVFLNIGIPVKLSDVMKAFNFIRENVPGVDIAAGKLAMYWDATLRTLSPESRGKEAKLAGAVIASELTQRKHRIQQIHGPNSKLRRDFWNIRHKEIMDFLRDYEKGRPFADSTLQAAADGYREWARRLFVDETRLGLIYEARDNYIYHVFEDGPGVTAYFEKLYGARWGDPGFTKDRVFELYEEAIKAGFKPKYSNPEDIMLARQHAHEVARTKIEMLEELSNHGLAILKEKGDGGAPNGFSPLPRRSPNKKEYWVHASADVILGKLYDQRGLWQLGTKGGAGEGNVFAMAAGSTFRGAMYLKNVIVPIILNVSGFHALHVLTIDNATAMVRASEELLAGKETALGWVNRMAKAATYGYLLDIYKNPKAGGRIVRIIKGEIPKEEWTEGDMMAVQAMMEGGFMPIMDPKYRTAAEQSFMDAVRKHSPKMALHAFPALLQLIQRPMFEVWIPNLKAASYLQDVASMLTIDPTLLMDKGRRMMAFREIAKSVDNRYGEMAYDVLFWDKWVKDLGVGGSLSLGWNLGFIREYGGGVVDLSTVFATRMPVRKAVEQQKLHKALFVFLQSIQAMAYAALITYLLADEIPDEWMDYFFPRSGEKNADGTDQRLNTMFYTREIVAIAKHLEQAGVIKGLGQTAANKASPALSLMKAFATGVDTLGREIRDPEAPAFKQLQQSLLFALRGIEPISIGTIRASGEITPKSVLLGITGFSPAAQYITNTPTENRIKHQFLKYFGAKRTPFERVEYSEDAKRIRALYLQDNYSEYIAGLDEIQEKHKLTQDQMGRLQNSVESGEDPTIKMFARLTRKMQVGILDEMTPEELEIYLPHAKEDLREDYEQPRKH
jgi:hypothetical protein